MAQTKKADNEDRAALAVTLPRSRMMVTRQAATSRCVT
jgi:hypothetical protein